MKSNRGSISILLILIVPIIAIGIFLIYDYLRMYHADNQVLKNVRNVSEIQLSNNNAHLYNHYGIMAYLHQDTLTSQLIAQNDKVTIQEIEIDHLNLNVPTVFFEATIMASKTLFAIEAVNQIKEMLNPYLENGHSKDFVRQMRKFEEIAEQFFDFHKEVKNLEKLKTSMNSETILKSIEKNIETKLQEMIKSYDTLINSEVAMASMQIQKYESLMNESIRAEKKWTKRIDDLRQTNKKIVQIEQEISYLQTAIDQKFVEQELSSEKEQSGINEEIEYLESQKKDSVQNLSMMIEEWNETIDEIIGENTNSKPMILDKIANLSSRIDEMLFDLEPVENLTLPLSELDLTQTKYINKSEIHLLDALVYDEYWMGILKSFDRGSVRNFNPLGTKDERDSVLKGEVEYLVAGKQSDPQNVQIIKMRLFSVRTVANVFHIASDATKTSQISRMTTALPIPWNTVAYSAIVTLWSSAEGYLDMISLFKGEGHHFIKTDDEWQLSIDNLMQGIFIPEQEKEINKNDKALDSKLYYQDYLRLMLYIQPLEVTNNRAMTLLDANVRKASENHFDLSEFSIGHKIDLTYLLQGLDSNQSVMSLVNKY